MNHPKVSIVINNFNYEHYLEQAITSALNQDYKHTEVIVVDDGSQDRSREIIDRYSNSITTIFKSNGGQASTFNQGFAASSGDIIIFLDADDYLLPNTVTEVVTVWNADTVKAHYPLTMIDSTGNSLGIHPHAKLPLPEGEVVEQLLQKGRYLTPVTSGNAFARLFLEQVLPMPETDYRLAADGYLTTLAPFYGQLVALDRVLGVYRIHGKNRWAMGKTSQIQRYRQFVKHDLLRYQLLERISDRQGRPCPKKLGERDYQHLKHRLLSIRLTPEQHPIPQESLLSLMAKGMRAALRDQELELLSKLWTCLWFVWMGLMPLGILRFKLTGLLPWQQLPLPETWNQEPRTMLCDRT